MTATKLAFFTFAAALVSIGAIVLAAPAAAQTCEGDCNGDHSVEIDEIILGVRAVLGEAPIDDCRAMDGDGSGTVTVDELVAAVTGALQGCGGAVSPTSTPTRTHTAASTNTPVPTNTLASTNTPVPTNTPVLTTIDEAALAASARVGTDPIFRFLDFQATIDAALIVAASSKVGTGQSTGVSGCQQFDCFAFGRAAGTREDCCSGAQFSQFFSNCVFDDDLGRVVTLEGLFTLASDTADVCTGALPVGTSFEMSLSNFTQDVRSSDGSFSHTFQELTETFEVTPGGCTAVSQPDSFGFGIRGDGSRFIDGELRQFQGDGLGNILVDTLSKVHGLAIAVGSTQQTDGCTVDAALRGSLTGGDFRVGRQFTTDFTDFHVVERPQTGALLLGLNGTVDADCVGKVTLSTIAPLRIASGDTCFTAGRLEAQLGDGRASVTYTQRAGLDFDVGADGSVDQHFATCADVPVDQCKSKAAGLCGACTGLNQCGTDLGCFPCSVNCSGNTMRCSLFDTFATCEDGVF